MAIVIRDDKRTGVLNEEICDNECFMLLCVQLWSFISSIVHSLHKTTVLMMTHNEGFKPRKENGPERKIELEK
jgi:hypothetical protein